MRPWLVGLFFLGFMAVVLFMFLGCAAETRDAVVNLGARLGRP